MHVNFKYVNVGFRGLGCRSGPPTPDTCQLQRARLKVRAPDTRHMSSSEGEAESQGPRHPTHVGFRGLGCRSGPRHPTHVGFRGLGCRSGPSTPDTCRLQRARLQVRPSTPDTCRLQRARLQVRAPDNRHMLG